MSILITLGSFLAVLVVLILAHELGHFITAKASKVKIEEFGLGFPPRLLSAKRGETLYSLNAIPLGGFTKMAGEEDPKMLGSLASKSIGTRLLVLSAGSLMNLLLPLLLFSIAFMVPHDLIVGEIVVEEVTPNSSVAKAGLKPGDIIISVNDRTMNNTQELNRYLYLNLGKKVTMLIQHTDSTIDEVQVTPSWKPKQDEEASIILFNMLNSTTVRQYYPFWKAIPMGVSECIETFVLFKNAIISLFIGAASLQLAGPVGIAQLTGEVAKAGISPLLEFAAFFSINLGIINIFPLPALDGGRIVFVLLEWVRRGKRIRPEREGLIHLIGFAMLMAVILVITYQDIIRIISGESLIP